MHLIHHEIRHFQIAINDVIDIKIVIIGAKGVDQDLSHSQESHVKPKLYQADARQENAVPKAGLKVQDLSAHHGGDEVDVNHQSHYMCVN